MALHRKGSPGIKSELFGLKRWRGWGGGGGTAHLRGTGREPSEGTEKVNVWLRGAQCSSNKVSNAQLPPWGAQRTPPSQIAKRKWGPDKGAKDDCQGQVTQTPQRKLHPKLAAYWFTISLSRKINKICCSYLPLNIKQECAPVSPPWNVNVQSG